MFYSIKFTLRSFFRDFFRGILARNMFYPKLLKNEKDECALIQYISNRTSSSFSKIKFSNGVNRITLNDKLLDKQAIQLNYSQYLYPLKLKNFFRSRISSSGTTGSPVTIVQDLGCIILEEAFVYRQLRWAGYRYRDRRVWLRGDIVSKDKPKNGFFGCHDWWTNTLMLSSYHISPASWRNYIERIERFDPVIIQAYPSSISILAKWLDEHKLSYTGKSLSGIVTSSETLDDADRDLIERVFSCRVFDWYGQIERVCAIGTCEHGSYHLLTDYSGVELLVAEGNKFELVGTSFNNKAFKLERYRTGDYVEISDKNCSCGRVFPVVDKIHGRKDKSICLPDGRVVTRLGHVFKDVVGIVEAQIVYLGADNFSLRVVPSQSWTDDNYNKLKSALSARIAGAKINIELVDYISRGPNGKFEFIRIETEE